MFRNWFAPLAFSMLLGCSSPGSLPSVAAQGLMSQVGGMDSVSALAGSLLGSLKGDSRLSSLLAGHDTRAMQPMLTNQLCSMLGGGCVAPVSEEQIASGAKKLTSVQADAVKEKFSSSLGAMNLSSVLQSALSNAIAPKLPGIIGALL